MTLSTDWEYVVTAEKITFQPTWTVLSTHLFESLHHTYIHAR